MGAGRWAERTRITTGITVICWRTWKSASNKVAWNSRCVLMRWFQTWIRHFRCRSFRVKLLLSCYTVAVQPCTVVAPPTAPPFFVRYTNRTLDIEGAVRNLSRTLYTTFHVFRESVSTVRARRLASLSYAHCDKCRLSQTKRATVCVKARSQHTNWTKLNGPELTDPVTPSVNWSCA